MTNKTTEIASFPVSLDSIKRVLIIENDPTERNRISNLIRKICRNVEEIIICENSQAVDHLLSDLPHPFNLVIIGQGISENNNVKKLETESDITRNIRAKKVNAPVLVYTINNNVRTGAEAIKAGADEVLAKAQTILLHKVIESTLSEAQKRIGRQEVSEFMEHATCAMLRLDKQGKISKANPAITQITNYSVEEIIGQELNYFDSGHPDDTNHNVINLPKEGESKQTVWIRKKDGGIIPVQMNIFDNRQSCVITEVPSLGFDALTGLHNQESFSRHLEKALHLAIREKNAKKDSVGLSFRVKKNDRFHIEEAKESPPKSEVAVLFLDLNFFKVINDTLGHLVGDKLLIEFSKRLKGIMRRSDTLARVGGDEFTIILGEITERNGMNVAKKMIKKIFKVLEKPFHINENELYIGTSIGVSLFSQDNGEDPEKIAETSEKLTIISDKRMQKAKNEGKIQDGIERESKKTADRFRGYWKFPKEKGENDEEPFGKYEGKYKRQAA